MNVLLYHLQCTWLQSSICASWQEWMGSHAVVVFFPSKADQKGHNKQPSMPQEHQNPGGTSWAFHSDLCGSRNGYDVNAVKQGDARPEFRVCLQPVHRCANSTCTNTTPWANHLTLHLVFSLYQGKVLPFLPCFVKQFDINAREAWCDCWVVPFVQHIGDTQFFANPSWRYRATSTKLQSELFGAKVNPDSFNRCWKLRTVMSSERDKNCPFLFKEILILCFNSNTIPLDQISELCTLSPKWLQITFVLTSAFPHVMEKGLTISWWLLS